MADIFANQTPVVVEKGASYTVVPDDNGKIFVATAAATFTLPPVADVFNGWNATFLNAADANLQVSAPSGKLVAFNNAAATSVALSTTSEKIGGGFRVLFLGTTGKYFAMHLTEETQTVTVA